MLKEMVDNVVKPWTSPELIKEQVTAVNGLMVRNFERITNYQMSRFKAYTEMGMAQIKRANDLRADRDLSAYLQSQKEAMGQLRQQMQQDAQGFMQMSHDMRADFQDVMHWPVKDKAAE